jgi:hypothetical protein
MAVGGLQHPMNLFKKMFTPKQSKVEVSHECSHRGAGDSYWGPFQFL